MNELLDILRRHEGLRLKPYLCPAGVPTIGYGHTGKDVSMSMGEITKERAEELLKLDANDAMRVALSSSPTLRSHPYKHMAIASFVFNLGIGRYNKSTLKKLIDAGKFEEASKEFERWVYAGGKKLNGLVKRREEERVLFDKQ